MSILEQIGTTEENYNSATGAASIAAWEPLQSGAYKATIKSVFVYKNTFGGNTMKYIVSLTDHPDRDIEFRQDISAKLKKDEATGVEPDNLGYANRLKQFAHAAGVTLEALSTSPTPIKHKIFGKDTDVTEVLGMKGKPIIALVRLSEDTEKAEGESYKFSNDLEGVCAMNGTDASGENAQALFEAKIEKSPVFKFKGKAKKGAATTDAPAMDPAAKAAAASLI